MANLITDPNFTDNPSNFWSTINNAQLNISIPHNPHGFEKGGYLPKDSNQIYKPLRYGENVDSSADYYFKLYIWTGPENIGTLWIIFYNSVSDSSSYYTPTQSGWTYFKSNAIRFNYNLYGIGLINTSSDSEIYVTDAYLGTSSDYCFNKGTKILCLVDNLEQYIPIEQLKNGDLVKTYLHGYRKIDNVMRSVFKNDTSYFQKSMYKMNKQGDMTDDLIVTGGHSILVDNYDSEEVKNEHKHLFGGELDPIDDKYLLLAGKSKLFEQIQGDDLFDIYHLCLEGDTPEHDKRYGIWANGVLTESTYKKIIYDVIKLN